MLNDDVDMIHLMIKLIIIKNGLDTEIWFQIRIRCENRF